MKKTFKMCTFFAVALFSILLFGKANVYAAEPTVLTQADFDAAKASPTVDTGKMKYQTASASEGSYNYYILTTDNYVLGGNINIGTATIGITSLAGKNITFDLDKYTVENATAKEYHDANVIDEGVLIVQNVATNIKGSGTIKYNGDTLAAVSFQDTNKANSQILTGITVDGRIQFDDTNVTINGITSQTVNFSDCNATINSGTFQGGIESAVYFFYDNGKPSLVINGGNFISAEDNGVEIGNLANSPVQYADITINGGVFKGAMSGVTINNYNTLSIVGGTFEYTDTTNGRGPIAIYEKTLNEVKNAISSKLNNGEVVVKNDGIVDYISINATKVTFGNATGSDESTSISGTNNEKDDTPKTKNYSNIMLYSTIFAISLYGIILFLKKGLNKANKNIG